MMRKFINDIKGYEQLEGYEILGNGILVSYWRNTNGNKRESYISNKPIIIKNVIDNKGYIRNRLGGRNKYSKSIRRHVLVAKAFISNPNNYNQVGHKDGNKINNHVSNLYWCNNSMNQQDSYKLGEKQLKYTEEQIICMLNNWSMNKQDLSKLTGISIGSMYDIYKGRAIMYQNIISKYKNL